MVPARFATQRDPGRRTMGPSVARVAQALGQPLMPWQRYVADVVGEVDARGRRAHRSAVISVPRQSGKTTLMLAMSVQRCLEQPRAKVWHTAQTGMHARAKWRELVELIQSSPLRDLVDEKRTRKGIPEHLVFTNGSQLSPFPPTRDALHGEQSDQAHVDEAWAFDDLQGADLKQAIGPTQATRPGAQQLFWSTRGDRHSTWFHGMVEAGYAGAGIALFDWGIPDGADPDDVDLVAAHHPAIGHTIELDFLHSERAGMAPSEYARAYGNRSTGNAERVIPAEVWHAAATEEPLPAGRPVFGVAASADGAWGAVVAAVADDQGRPWVEVLAHRPGRSWIVDYIRALQTRDPVVAVERRGPAASVAGDLELAGVELLADGTAYPAACQDLYDRVCDTDGPRLFHRRSEALDAAADCAGRRVVHDGGWVWSRAKSTGDVSALEAATLAAWAVARAPRPAARPVVVFS